MGMLLYSGCLIIIILSGCTKLTSISTSMLIDADTSCGNPQVMFVLGGNAYERALYSGMIARKCNIKKIICLGNDTIFDLMPFNITITYSEAAARHIETLYPDISATVEFHKVATSTYEEIIYIKKYTDSLKLDTFAILTSLYHTGRVRWLCKKLLDNKKVIYIYGSNPYRFDPYHWSNNEEGIIAFSIEFLKNIYYRIKY